MNFSQLQERVRLELLRRIERGTLSVSLLARQTGLGQGHISNFLRSRRQLSLGTLDKIMAAQHIDVADLLPSERETGGRSSLLVGQSGEFGLIPLVSHSAAVFETHIRPSNVQRMLSFPSEMVGALRPRCTPSRKQWERFVAVRVGAQEANAMAPLILPDALVVLDRQYNSFKPYREWTSTNLRAEPRSAESGLTETRGANIYGVRNGSSLLLRYADFKLNRLLLRPHQLGFSIEVLQMREGESPNDLLIGRVALVVNEL